MTYRSCSESYRYAAPKVHLSHPRAADYAEAVDAIANLAGGHLQDWQRDMISDFSAVDEDGKFVHSRCGASIPRQAGKSEDAIWWVVFLLIKMGASVLWTDHNYSTTTEMLRRFRRIFGKKPNDPDARYRAFNRMLLNVNNKTAQESMTFTNGAVLCFSTRTKSATLGYSFDVIVYDEAQELTDEHQQAILPTFTSGTLHNPQVIYLGTPARPGGFGHVFERIREEALAGEDDTANLCWWEWGVDEIGDVYDESRWSQVNPSLENGIANIEAIRAALPPSMTELAFAQEFLGYWLPKATADAVIDAEEWNGLYEANPPKEGIVCYAVKFSPSNATASIACCRRAKDRRPHVECVKHQDTSAGISWAAEWLLERQDRAAQIVVDGFTHSGDLIERLSKAGVKKKVLIAPKSTEVATACSMFANAVTEGELTHFAQAVLTASATHTKKRPIGNSGGWGFEGIDGVDETPVEAAALAYWAAMTTKRDPDRKMRVSY